MKIKKIKMTSQQVVQRYKSGVRDFQEIDLRGQSFKNFKNLSLTGADFRGADIRGTNFSKTDLSQTKFIGVIGGIQKSWRLRQQLVGVATGLTCVILIAFLLFVFLTLISVDQPPKTYQVLCTISTLLFLTTMLLIAWQGFTAKAFNSISVAVIVAVVAGVAVAVGGVATVGGAENIGEASSIAGPVVVGGAMLLAIVLAGGLVLAAAVFLAGFLAGAGVLILAEFVTGFLFLAVVINVFGTVLFEKFQAVVGADFLDLATAIFLYVIEAGYVVGAVLLFSVYFAWQTYKGTENFLLLRIWSNRFRSIGGTNFAGDLTGADFKDAMLKSTNLQKAILTHVYWKGAQLDFARWGRSILANSKLRELLVSGNGEGLDYSDLNLSGANLTNTILNGAIFKRTNLNGAILCRANLKDANLREAQCLETDFTRATLTGACIQDWNIDHDTKLDDVKCREIYLLDSEEDRHVSTGNFDYRERLPVSPNENFDSGVFTKIFQEVRNTVDLIFQNGVDWKSLVKAVKEVQVNNEDIPLKVQSIDDKGDGVFVVRVSVPPDVDKERLHSELVQKYEKLKALAAKYRAELQAKDGIIVRYSKLDNKMDEILDTLAKKPTITFGDITGSIINLGSISGSVTNSINQLLDTKDPNQAHLKELLTQLQTAIEEENDLPDGDKADLLGEVQNLAEAKQTEDPARKEGLVRKAKKIFEATLKSLPETAKLAEASSKLLPLILKVLGFPM